jgi:hypothetical protein
MIVNIRNKKMLLSMLLYYPINLPFVSSRYRSTSIVSEILQLIQIVASQEF